MGQGGLEPPTPRLSSVCSNQLSYWPQSLHTHAQLPPRKTQPKGLSRRGICPWPEPSGQENPASQHLYPSQTSEPGYAVSARIGSHQPPALAMHPSSGAALHILCVCVVISQFANQPKPHPRQRTTSPGRHEQASYVFFGNQQTR